MMRWRQVYNKELGKHEMVPVDEAAAKRDGVIIVREVEPSKSPIDGSVISSHKKYVEHCRKHNVVPAAEFSKEFFERKAKERAKFYNAEYSAKEKQARKAQIWEIWNAIEAKRS